jgi:hypothetical protein
MSDESLETATRNAVYQGLRFHTTVRWHSQLFNKIINRDVNPSESMGQLVRRFYAEVCKDIGRPSHERLFDLHMLRDHHTLVGLDLKLESMLLSLGQYSNRPGKVAHFWAMHAPIEMVDGDTLLMQLVKSFSKVSTLSCLMLKGWLERTSNLTQLNYDNKSVISLALDAAGPDCASPLGVLRLLLESGRFDLNALDASLGGESIAARILCCERKAIPVVELLSYLFQANPFCLDLSTRNADGHSLVDLTRKSNHFSSSKCQYLVDHKARMDTVWMPLLERHVEAHTRLPLAVCGLIRQYLDGSGHAF